MDSYESIPEGAVRLYLARWNCGDTCHCNCYEIRAEFPIDHPHTPLGVRNKRDKWSSKIWESSWFWPMDGDGYDDLREEIDEACRHYGIPFDKDSKDPYGDWNGERRLQADDQGGA
jgi:hypothetical protein